MNANSKPTTPPTINSWLIKATSQLAEAHIPSARLDAELILAHVHKQSRIWLIAHQNDNITDPKVLDTASKLLVKRLQRVPVAYLTNHKEFYNRSFFVDESVLIPRPESEMIIEIVKDLMRSVQLPEIRSAVNDVSEDCRVEEAEPKSTVRLLDVGTGSGCLGITAKLEFPELLVTLSDISPEALSVARHNAKTLKADVDIVVSDLLAKFEMQNSKFDIIIANLPYVDRSWERSPETSHEPGLALFAKDSGLELIKKCIQQASTLTSDSGYLLLESDPEQHQEIIDFASKDFRHVSTIDYIVALQKLPLTNPTDTARA